MKIDSYFGREAFRPHKLIVLYLGLGILLAGANHPATAAPDWTAATSISMALATHFLAPWSVDTVMRLRWRWMPLAAFFAWLTVDGVWMLSIDGSDAAWGMRSGQWQCSLCLFSIYGLLLRGKGTLRERLTFKKSQPTGATAG